jgi:hypothetical protein
LWTSHFGFIAKSFMQISLTRFGAIADLIETILTRLLGVLNGVHEVVNQALPF